MQSGGERLLIVPSNLGYGSRKIDGIPANSTLRFGVLRILYSREIMFNSTSLTECKLLEIKG